MVPRSDHRTLLTKGQNLQMAEDAATEQTRQGKKQRREGRLNLQDATFPEEKKATGSFSTTFPVGTTFAAPFICNTFICNSRHLT